MDNLQNIQQLLNTYLYHDDMNIIWRKERIHNFFIMIKKIIPIGNNYFITVYWK